MSLNLEFKKKKLIKELKRRDFTFDLISEKKHSTTFGSYQMIGEWKCIITLTLLDTTADLIFFNLGPLNNNYIDADHTEEVLLEFFNFCNSKNSMFVVYIDKDKDIIARSTSFSNEFDAEQYLNQALEVHSLLINYCPIIMPFIKEDE